MIANNAELNVLLNGFAEAVISIFAIMNPIGNIPVFTALTEEYPIKERRHIFRVAGITAMVLILVMAVIGRFLLRYVFHIGMNEFMFGGGIILMVVGIRHILSGINEPKTGANLNDRNRKILLAVSPIGCPLLVGPGSIVTTMLIVEQHGSIYGIAAAISAFLFVFIVLNYAHVISRIIGRIGTLAIGRIMQIFIVAIGSGFVFRGIQHLLK